MDKKKVVSSLIYKFIERLSVKGLGLVIGIVLARMLDPDQFGLIAIMNVFINLSQVIVEGGFTTALIQRKDVTEKDYSTVFYINITLAAVCFMSLELAAPWISNFYEKDITLPLRIYAITVFFSAFNALQLARLQKRMQFRKIMICSLIATIISGIAGVVGAYCNLGLWALILYHSMYSVVACITVAFVEKWLPKIEFSLSRAKVLFSYGWKMFISAVLCSLYADVRSLVIGKKFSSDHLAHYDRGQKFPQIISHTLDSSIQSVMFPTMASVQDDKKKLARMLRSAETMGAYVVIPVMLGLAAVSESFVRLLLTEKWLPCVPYMQWLCIANAAVPITSSNLIAIKSTGRSDIYMRLEMIRRVVMLAILIISVVVFKSVLAIAISFCISSWLDALITMTPVKRLIGYGFASQLADIWKIVAASLVMFAGVFAMNLLQLPDFLLLALQILVGAGTFLLLGWLLRLEPQKNLFKLAGKMLKRKK